MPASKEGDNQFFRLSEGEASDQSALPSLRELRLSSVICRHDILRPITDRPLTDGADILAQIALVAQDNRDKPGGPWVEEGETQIKIKVLKKVHLKKNKVGFDVEYQENKGKYKKGQRQRFRDQDEDGPSRSVEKAYENPEKFDCELILDKGGRIIGSKNPPKQL